MTQDATQEESPNVIRDPNRFDAMPVGIVLRRTPGVTRWAAWVWKAVDVLPGAGQADWRVLREDRDATFVHAATPTLELHGADTEAYLHGLTAVTPSLYAVLREADDHARPLEVVLLTASPYEAQDYADNGEDIVEKIAMPPAIQAWVSDFVDAHHQDEVFKKRKRDKKDIGLVEDGIGDVRISQLADVYRSPILAKKERLQ